MSFPDITTLSPQDGAEHIIGEQKFVYSTATGKWEKMTEIATARYSAPAYPYNGQLWFDIDSTGRLYIWNEQATSWIQLTGHQLDGGGHATTGYVDTAIANLVDSSPTTLNTLNEIAAAIGDDPNFGTSLTTSITSKLNIADFNNKADQWASGNLSLSTLSDVGTNPPTNNQILSYDAQSGYWYGADLIDAEASGAVMKVSVTTSGIGFVVDEDDLVSNSDTKVPTQQSVKAYVDTLQSSTSNFAALAGNLDDIADGVTYKKSENNFTPGLKNKLDNINTSLYVTYSTLAADITTAGAQMTSTLAADITTAGAIMKSASNGSATIPNGTTSQRDSSPNAGFFRWNTTTSSAEIYDGNVWGLVGGGNTTSEIMWEHFRDVSSNYQIETGNNAVAAGTITIESGGSVEIPTGSTWAIV